MTVCNNERAAASISKPMPGFTSTGIPFCLHEGVITRAQSSAVPIPEKQEDTVKE